MPGRRESRQRRFHVAIVAAALLFLVPVLAEWNVSRHQEQRRSLGDQLYRESRGRGLPIVLLAGFQGSTRYWSEIAHRFGDDRRVLRIDALGFGRSPWPNVSYTLDDHLGALERTLRAEAVTSSITFVAHSFGTILAAHFAERHPEQVARIILLGTPSFDSPEEARGRIQRLSPLAAVFSLNPTIAQASCEVLCAFRPIFRRIAPWFADVPPEVASDSVLHSWDSFRGTLENVILSAPIRNALRSTGTKVVFVHGEHDPVTPILEIERLATEVGAQVIRVDADHHGYLDEPDRIIDLARNGTARP